MGADHLAHRSGAYQCRNAGVAVAGIVVDDGKVAYAAREQRVKQRAGNARAAEAAHQHGGAVSDAGHGLFQGCHGLVDHF